MRRIVYGAFFASFLVLCVFGQAVPQPNGGLTDQEHTLGATMDVSSDRSVQEFLLQRAILT